MTLVEGQTFCLSGRTGDLTPHFVNGLFFLDTRILSRWELRVNGDRVEPLTVDVTEPFAATFLGRVNSEAGKADTETVAYRHRSIGSGMRERIVLVHHGLEPTPLVVELACDVDFAGLFEVKESRVRPRDRQVDATARSVRFDLVDDEVDKSVRLAFSEPATIEDGVVTWRGELAPRESWELCIEVEVALAGEVIAPRFRCGIDDVSALPAQRLASWRATLPVIDTDVVGMAQAVRRAGEDLGSLRIFDPEHPETPILAAGTPWFMTLFGRDSLLTSWMTLLADPTLARGVLDTLARLQGEDVNAVSEEEPGRILHEVRFGSSAGPSLRGGDVYFGTIDATPLFVMLLGELRRWGASDETTSRLLPHADRALAWIEQFGDRDGDGYVEYQQRGEHGLANQGWKDSWDALRHVDGELARAPIALCEVQGYVYAAYLARAHLAIDAGDASTATRYRAKASELRRRFNEDFWVEEAGWYAMGLDADKRPVAALASNMGHCLWTGIIDPDARRAGGRAAAVAADVLGVGGPHLGLLDARLQPGQLPQRLDLAPRQRHLRGRSRPLRVRRGSPPADRCAGRGGDDPSGATA